MKLILLLDTFIYFVSKLKIKIKEVYFNFSLESGVYEILNTYYREYTVLSFKKDFFDMCFFNGHSLPCERNNRFS